MIGTHKIAVLGALAVMSFAAMPAHATLGNMEMLIIDALHPAGVLVTCATVSGGAFSNVTISCVPGSDEFSFTYKDADASINVIDATGGSPVGSTGLTLEMATTDLKVGTITVELSQTGYAEPVGFGAAINLSATQNMGGSKGFADGTSNMEGFSGPGAPGDYFCSPACTGNTGAAAFAALGPATSINSSNLVTFPATFALEDVIKQTFTKVPPAASQTDANVYTSSVVPEPTSVLLFGTVVLFVAGSIRRKTRKA
jgi:hypothetical protein